jgi:serine protease Do
MKGSEGALIVEPQVGSPAAKAGILSGDVITAVNGHPI